MNQGGTHEDSQFVFSDIPQGRGYALCPDAILPHFAHIFASQYASRCISVSRGAFSFPVARGWCNNCYL